MLLGVRRNEGYPPRLSCCLLEGGFRIDVLEAVASVCNQGQFQTAGCVSKMGHLDAAAQSCAVPDKGFVSGDPSVPNFFGPSRPWKSYNSLPEGELAGGKGCFLSGQMACQLV